MLPKLYYQSLEPIYIIVDVVQEFIDKIESSSYEEDEAETIIINALAVGVTMIVTALPKVRGVNKLGGYIKDAKMGLILGDIREQTIFSYSGIRESNNQVDIGYLHYKGTITKVKIPENMEQ